MTQSCPDCGDEYKQVASHISLSDCEWGELSNEELSMMKGLLLGDGSIQPNGRLVVESVERDFIDWLQKNYGHLITRTNVHRTAEENAEHSSSNNVIGVSDNPDDYRATHRANFTVRPETKQLREEWYGEDGKEIPDELELTPMMAKMWYAGDGHLHGRIPRICTRSDNRSRERGLIEEAGFDVSDSGQPHYFRVTDYDFLDWMGEPPDGFEYKFDD